MSGVFAGSCPACVVCALRGRFYDKLCKVSLALGLSEKVRRLDELAMNTDLLTTDSVTVLARFLDNEYQALSYYEKINTRNSPLDHAVIISARWHVIWCAIFLGHAGCLDTALKAGWNSLNLPNRETLLELSNIFAEERFFDKIRVDDIVKCFGTLESLLKIQQ
jgi:hypothetical protein